MVRVLTTIKLTSHHMKLAHPKEHYLVQTESHGKISYCYHLDYLAKMRPATFDIQHPFRIICSSCHIALATELTSKERIFALERMKNYAVKYLLFTKGCIKVGTLMRTKKLKSLWTDPFIERFLKVFEHKENSEDMHEDLLWCLKNLEFDQDVYKFAVNSPYYQQQFLPKRNINMIDVRYVLERLLSVHIIYHKIANPEYKLNDGEMPAAMPQMELVDIVEMPEEPEPVIEPPPQKEEVKYEPVHLLYERKGRLEVENMAPYSALRVNNEWDGKDLTDREFEQEIKALKIIYPDFICFGAKTTHALIETNMDNITYKLPVLKEIVLKCPLQGGFETSFSKRMYFIYESKPVRMFFLVYPRPGAGLKEWVIHSTELFTSGVNIQDKPNVEKCITLREKFLVGLNKVLKDLIPKNVFIPTGHTVFPKTTNHLKEHFGTLGDKILPSQYPKRACLSVIKKSLENWENFGAARNFTITIEDIAQAAERYPHKGIF